MKKIFSLFAALTLCAGLWAAAPANAESVDLGLPSGLKWATFNVGATAPEGNGDYFAWGETEPYYSSQDPLTWKTGKENGYAWESYCGASDFTEWSTAPYDATTKNLKPEFDAATANWGSDWRMPTKAEQDELIANCTWTWTEDYNGTGIKGYVITSKAEGNTNSIFLPFAGRYSALLLYNNNGSYWSSSLYEDYSNNAYFLYFVSNYVDCDFASNRSIGLSVRPVTTKLIVPVTPKVGDQFVDTTSSLKFEVTAVGDTNTVKVIKNSYTGTSYTVPDTVKYLDVDFAVTEIGTRAFDNCESLQSITIPDSVITIGTYAFEGCESLQTITIPAGVTEIGAGAFAASGLQTITIPAGVTEIQTGAFYECTGLTSVTFLGNACQDAIGGHAFDGVGDPNPALLTLPDNWTGTIPDEDGNWYGGVFNLAAPAPVEGDQFVDATSGLMFEVTAVGEANTVKVMKNDYTGTSYTVPATVSYNDVTFAVTEIGEEAFEDCSSLESINLSNVTTIGESAFAFSGLTSITIPTSVTSIGEAAFYDCSSLQSVTLSEGLLTIGESAFEGCSSLESVTIPESVTTIGKGAFEECFALQTITIPASVTTIGEGAFSYCSSLQSITIPAGVTEIQMGAFYECAGLTSVTFLGNACQNAIGEMAFMSVGKDAPALLTLPNSWTGSKPDEDGNWYGGKFELSEDPSALPTLFGDGVKGNKFMHNGQLIIRKGEKNYNAVGF